MADGVEAALHQIWSEVMPGHEWVADKSLLELGISSLKAMEIALRIERRFKRPINFSVLKPASTFLDLLAVLQRDGSDAPAQSSTHGAGVMIPGIFGEELYLAAFRERIGATVRFTCIDLPGLDAPPELHTRIDQMAEVVVARLAEVGDDPVHLAGISYGGIVAHAVALRLVESGRPPRSLILVDPLLKPSKRDAIKRALARLWARPRSSADTTILEANRGSRRLRAIATLVASLLLIIGAFRLVRRMVLRFGPDLGPGWTVQRTREYLAVTRSRAVRAWSPQPCHIPTTMLISQDFATQSSMEVWKRACPDLKCSSIAADHFTLFLPPHVAETERAFLDGIVSAAGTRA